MGKNTKLSYVMHNCLLQLHRSGMYISPWLECIRNICIECVMVGVWITQTVNNPEWFGKAVQHKLRDLWTTKWYGNVTTRGICNTYKLYKQVYGMEEYLLKLTTNNRLHLSKFRTGNNRLPIITGRYNQIVREERFCTKCNNGLIGDEHRVLLLCQNPDIVQLTNRYIVPEYYRQHPNIDKFVRLVQTRNTEMYHF